MPREVRDARKFDKENNLRFSIVGCSRDRIIQDLSLFLSSTEATRLCRNDTSDCKENDLTSITENKKNLLIFKRYQDLFFENISDKGLKGKIHKVGDFMRQVCFTSRTTQPDIEVRGTATSARDILFAHKKITTECSSGTRTRVKMKVSGRKRKSRPVK